MSTITDDQRDGKPEQHDARRLPIAQRLAMSYEGPLPPAAEFQRYNAVVPGAADRILKMAEIQATHRQGIERLAVLADVASSMMGTVLAYIAFGGTMWGAVYLLMNDKPIQALVTLVAALAIITTSR